MKKVFSVFLVLAMFLTILPAGVITVSAAEGDFVYETNSTGVTITDYVGPGGDVIIPNTLGGYPVTEIYGYANPLDDEYGGAFYGHADITSVTIPESVTRIGECAFWYNPIKTINFNAVNCTYMGYYWDGIRFISAFETDVLTTVNFGSHVKTIPNFAFSNTGIKEITMPDSVTTIGSSAFSNTGIKELTIPENIKNIGHDAFDQCSIDLMNFNAVNCASDNIFYGSIFEGCMLNAVRFGSNVQKIPDIAFAAHQEITSITITGSETSIGDRAFEGCTGLADIEITGNMVNFGSAFFDTAWYNNQPDGLVYLGKAVYQYKGTMPANTSITLKADIKGISDWAFSECTGLVDIDMPEGLISIGDAAFSDCTGLTEIIMPDSVTSIGDCAFYGCTGLKTMGLPGSLTSIGDYAFQGCSGLMNIVIQENVTRIGESAFDGTAWFNNQPNGLVYLGKVAYRYRGTMPANTSITLKAGTKGIAGAAFAGCTNLTDIVIPNDVTNIGNYAFSSCKWLTEIVIPGSVTSIGEGAFRGCSGLANIVIPGSVTSIQNFVFYECTGLADVVISDGVMIIGNCAFEGCTKLEDIIIPGSVATISDFAFAQCTGLNTIVIPGSVTRINNNAFYKCPNLTMYCYENSVAHTYAKSKSIKYKIISIAADPGGPGCKIDYNNKVITGLSCGLTSLDGYLDIAPGCTVSYTPTPKGFGTGTLVNVIKNGITVESYKAVIFGDVTGDGNIDSIDAGAIVDFENYKTIWDPVADAAKIKAGDVNGDGNIDSIDAGIAVDAENYRVIIDQITGLATAN